jgi:hypothetical protein
MRIAAPGTESGAFVGMVIGYWEQACALLNYGLLHEDLFFETSGEFFGVWELFKPVVPEFRERFADKIFSRIWRKPLSASKSGRNTARLVILPP